jgi:hypothetical protein
MPYIRESDRTQYREFFSRLPYIKDEGNLNYVLSKVILDYIGNKDHSYATFNAVIGVLSCIKMELYRRVISFYEDEKIKQNGDLREMGDV